MKRSLVTLLLVASALALIAGGVTPPSIGPKAPNISLGGRAVAIAVDPADDNKIVVASESGGLFRSTNRGANWTQVSANSTFWFTDVTYVPSNPNIILATAQVDTRTANGGGIWRSSNGGGAWSQVSPAFPNWCNPDFFAGLALYAETWRDRVWAGTDCGLAYSDDQGASWNFVPSVFFPVYSVVSPTAGRLAIYVYSGVSVSNDDGGSWNSSTAGFPPYSYFFLQQHDQLAASPVNPDHLYLAYAYSYNGLRHNLVQSVDFGKNWNSLADDHDVNRPPFVRLASSLSGDSTQYDVYYSNGSLALVRATADGSGSISPWTYLTFDHPDFSDLAFANDHKTPILLASDGGLHKTPDNGLSWALTGAGPAGYNALQIAEATGQLHNDGVNADLYFATQDNHFWASPDSGASWPAFYGTEGVYLNIPRDFYPANQTNLSGSDTGTASLFISGPQFAGVTTFPSAPKFTGASRLLSPGTYLQQALGGDGNPSAFDVTTNTGQSWLTRFAFPEPVLDLPKPAGAVSDPVVYAPIKVPGVTSKGYERIQLKRISDVLGNNSPLVSNISGFGDLGRYATMWLYYVSFGVDPNDPNYLMVSDVDDDQVKVSSDGGASWAPDTNLTDLVTQSGKFKFSWAPGWTQTTVFAFDPECPGHIVVGTMQAGIFESYDRGGSWWKLGNSDRIPEVSSVFFLGGGNALISSYGRGLWQYSYPCPSKPLQLPKTIQVAEPTIFWKGAKVPISQIHDPDVCPACAFFPIIGGKIIDYKTDPGTGALLEVAINQGTFKGYGWDGSLLPIPFGVTNGHLDGAISKDPLLRRALEGPAQIKGLFMEGNILRGLILADSDLSADALPKKVLLGPHIDLSGGGLRSIDDPNPTLVTGVGFDPARPLEIFLDGKPVQPDAPPDFDPQGNFTFPFTPQVDLGVHSILVRQGAIQDISTFLVTVHETEP